MFDYEIENCKINSEYSVLVVIDMFNAIYEVDVINTSNISIKSSYKLEESFTKFIRCIYAKKNVQFNYEIYYGSRGGYSSEVCYKEFTNYTVNSYYNYFKSLFSIISRFNESNEDTISKFRDVLNFLLDNSKADIIEEDLINLDYVNDMLKKFYTEQIKGIMEKIAQRNISNNTDISLEEIFQNQNYRELFIKKPSIGTNRYCNIERLQLESFSGHFIKNSEKLNKLIALNTSMENLDIKINHLLDNTYFLKLDNTEIPSEELIFIVLNDTNQCVDASKIQKNNLTVNTQILCKYIVDDKMKILCVTSRKKSLVSIIEMYVDVYIAKHAEVIGQEKIARFFKSIDEIKVNTVFSDQLPIMYKLDLPVSKRGIEDIYIEFYKRTCSKSIYVDRVVKQEIIRDFTSEIYGNGYCCSLTHCDFSVPNEHAYGVLEVIFRSYSLPIIVCKNHEALLDKKNIQIIDIHFANESIDSFIKSYSDWSNDYRVPGKYRNVKISYIEKYNAEVFNMDKEFEDETDENIIQSTFITKLTPILFSYWLNQIMS